MLSKIYYRMGLIHFQLCRYAAALHVMDYSLETLMQAFPSPLGSYTCSKDVMEKSLHPSLNESIPYLSSCALLLMATILTGQAKIYMAQGKWTTAKNYTQQVMICLANERIRRGIGHPKPHRPHTTTNIRIDIATQWSLTMARAQVILGQTYQQKLRPAVAMRCFQDALTIQRYILGDHHVQVADTVHRIGDFHTSQSFLGPAAACYHEALRVYQLRHRADKTCTMEIATILASLGWISLLQHNFPLAWTTTHQALDLTIQSGGSAHRNVASIRFQLGWIHWWSKPAFPQSPGLALKEWKRALKRQERVIPSKTSSSSSSSSSSHNRGRSSKVMRHVDLAKTLHAISQAYQAMGRWDKANFARQAAEKLYH
jgi:tetratricopeptide (TPR) repeat protein